MTPETIAQGFRPTLVKIGHVSYLVAFHQAAAIVNREAFRAASEGHQMPKASIELYDPDQHGNLDFQEYVYHRQPAGSNA